MMERGEINRKRSIVSEFDKYYLSNNGARLIENNTLVALTLMVAESRTE
jgi:hypothetical protein